MSVRHDTFDQDSYDAGYINAIADILSYVFLVGNNWNDSTIQKEPLVKFLKERKRLYDSS